MRQSLLTALVVLGAARPAGAARVSSVSPEMDRLLLEGVDAIFRMDFPAADEAARKALALDPALPHAYLGRAATDMIRYLYGAEGSDPSLLEGFEAKVDGAVAAAERWLKAHPGDPDGLLVLGAAHGLAGRMAMSRRDWLDAFRHGRRSMKSVRAALRADPEFHDAGLGAGMFDYYADALPRLSGWLAKVMLGGNREKGLAGIKAAAERGHYGRVAAQLILVEIYIEDRWGARDTAAALRIMEEVRARYPRSSMIHDAYILALYEDGRHEQAAAESAEFLRRVESGEYAPINRAKGHALRGTSLWAAGRKEEALADYAQAAAVRPRTRSAVWSLVRAGQLLDSLGRRAEAVASYRAALSERGVWDYAGLVRPCLDKPCLGEYPGRYGQGF